MQNEKMPRSNLSLELSATTFSNTHISISRVYIQARFKDSKNMPRIQESVTGQIIKRALEWTPLVGIWMKKAVSNLIQHTEEGPFYDPLNWSKKTAVKVAVDTKIHLTYKY